MLKIFRRAAKLYRSSVRKMRTQLLGEIPTFLDKYDGIFYLANFFGYVSCVPSFIHISFLCAFLFDFLPFFHFSPFHPDHPSILFPSTLYNSLFSSSFLCLSFIHFAGFTRSFSSVRLFFRSFFCPFMARSFVHFFIHSSARPLNLCFIQSLFHFLEPPPDLLGLFKDHEDWHLQRFFVR